MCGITGIVNYKMNLLNNLDDIEKLAADCNNDNQPIGVKDYIRMRLIILMQDSKSN